VLLNRDRALAYLREARLDALIATSPISILYLSDYFCWLDPLFKNYMVRPGASSDLFQNFAVLPLDAEPALVVAGLWGRNASDSWIADVRMYGSHGLDYALAGPDLAPAATWPDAFEALRGVLADRGLLGGRLGVELDALPSSALHELRKVAPQAALLDCSNLLRLVRMVKAPEEVRRLEASTRINRQVSTSVLANAEPDTPMRALRERYLAGVAAAGAEIDHFIYAPLGMGLLDEPDYQLSAGDTLFVDFGCVYGHYYSDNGTTLSVGGLAPPLAQRYAALAAGMAEGTRQLRPGVRASQVHAAMIESLAESGITACNAHGHGVGLEVRDYPIIVADTGLRIRDDCVDVPADLPLEAGMVVNLELPLFLAGAGSLHIEQTFLVTGDAPRRLDAPELDRSPIVVAEAVHA
jgi:Xaa-Pro aminopeptidase